MFVEITAKVCERQGIKSVEKVIVWKYTSIFKFIMPVCWEWFFALALEKRAYRLKYASVFSLEELNKLAVK